MRYTACTGLINQHYSHIAAFALATVLGAELVLPPAVCRDSFAHYFSVFKEKNEVQWSPVPLDTLLDVNKVFRYWKKRGMVLHKVGGGCDRMFVCSGWGGVDGVVGLSFTNAVCKQVHRRSPATDPVRR
jgi:hypothetical protein